MFVSLSVIKGNSLFESALNLEATEDESSVISLGRRAPSDNFFKLSGRELVQLIPEFL